MEDRNNEKLLFWEAYFIYDLQLMNKIALVLGNKKDAERFSNLCSERKAFFNKTFIQNSTGETIFKTRKIDTQASYALILAFDIAEEKIKKQLIKNFINSITRINKTDQGIECPPYSLMTGFIGTAWICKALSDNGYSNIAYRLLQQTEYPSWLYPVIQGATTIWERLNSYTHTNGFGGNNSMNSFNHYSFGAIGAWMYNYSLGIVRDENVPGFKHFMLQPEPDTTGNMTFASGFYDSMYGRIESSWKITDTSFEYHFVVPSNTTATVRLIASSARDISVGKKPLLAAVGIKHMGERQGKVYFDLQPGKYLIKVKR